MSPDLASVRLVRPELLWLLLLLLPIGYLLWRMTVQARWVLPNWLPPTAYRYHRPVTKNVLRGLSLLFLLLAVLGPTVGTGSDANKALGRQIYFVLDVSGSMNVQDLQPSRLAVAKREIGRVAQQLQGEQLGLIVFTDVAFAQVPLTSDLQTFQTFLDLVNTNQFANTGTDYRIVLGEVYRRFLAERRNQAADQRLARAVVFVTDSDNHGDTKYQSWLNALDNQGVELFVVGVGTRSGGAVPQLNEQGAAVGFKHTPSGAIATARLKMDSLQALARMGGSSHIYLLESNGANLDALASRLQNLPPSLEASPERLAPIDRYQWLLLPSILCLLASLVLLPQRRGAGQVAPAQQVPEPQRQNAA